MAKTILIVDDSSSLRTVASITGCSWYARPASITGRATEIALKMSAHYWRNLGRPGKSRFIGLAGGYHGETVGALAVTDVAIFRDAYAPLVRAGSCVPSPDARKAAGEALNAEKQRLEAAIEAVFGIVKVKRGATLEQMEQAIAAGRKRHAGG